MRSKIAAGNWKMNLTFQEACKLIETIVASDRPNDVITILAVPYVYLNKAKQMTEGFDNIAIAAQNVSNQMRGAYTGEISAEMLSSTKIPYALIGHSERRQYFNEGDEILLTKLKLSIEHGIKPIFCCGEPLDVRQDNRHEAYVVNQIERTIGQLHNKDIANCIIAYEPIWAIGTGETASAQQAQSMHKAIRQKISIIAGKDIAELIPILYGGSVKPANANEIFGQADVDGGLVGGASLNASDFSSIINAF